MARFLRKGTAVPTLAHPWASYVRSARSAGRQSVVMRKFVSVAALAAVLLPAVAHAHEEGNSPGGTANNPPTPESSSSSTPSGEPEPPPEHRLPWANSALNLQFSANVVNMLAPPAYPAAPGQSELCQNTGTEAPSLSCANTSAQPTVDFTFYFRPRWTFSRNFQIRGLLVGSVEMTDTAFTTTSYKNQWLFSDPSVDFYFTGLPTFAGFKVNLAIRTTFPLSLTSQAQTRIMGLGAVVNIARPIHHVLGGNLNLGITAGYLHPFYEYTTPGLSGFPYARNCAPAQPGDASCTGQAGGSFNVANAFSFIFSAQLEWTRFNISTFMWVTDNLLYSANPGYGSNLSAIANPSTVRDSEFFLFSMEYTPNNWLGIEAGYFMTRSFLNGAGQIGNPIWDPYQDSRVYMGLNFTLDRLFEAVTGTGSHATTTASTPPTTPTRASLGQRMAAF